MTVRRLLLIGALSLLPAVSYAGTANAASFDCTAAKTADEKAVCVNRNLSDLDVKAATLYEVLGHLVAMGQRGDLQDQQRAFLAHRATCGSRVPCIAKVYEQRIDVLNKGLQAIYARGPF